MGIANIPLQIVSPAGALVLPMVKLSAVMNTWKRKELQTLSTEAASALTALCTVSSLAAALVSSCRSVARFYAHVDTG